MKIHANSAALIEYVKAAVRKRYNLTTRDYWGRILGARHTM